MTDMATIDEVIVAICDTITNATGLRSGMLTDTVNVGKGPFVQVYPAAEIGDGDTYYQSMNRGVVTIQFYAQVLCSSIADRAQLKQLHEAISPSGQTSIPKAIFDHPTLGTVADETVAGSTARMSAKCSGMSAYGFTTDEPRYLTATIRIHVQLTRDRS